MHRPKPVGVRPEVEGHPIMAAAAALSRPNARTACQTASGPDHRYLRQARSSRGGSE